jgi:hypothetical protein
MIPFGMFGTVHLKCGGRSNAATVKAVATRLAAILDEKECSDVSVEGNRVRFRNKLFGGSIRFSLGGDWDDFRSSFLGVFDSGTFDIDATLGEVSVRYNLNAFRLWIAAVVMIAFFVAAGRVPLTLDALWSHPLLPIVAFLAIYYIGLWIYVPFWLRRGLNDVNELSMKV